MVQERMREEAAAAAAVKQGQAHAVTDEAVTNAVDSAEADPFGLDALITKPKRWVLCTHLLACVQHTCTHAMHMHMCKHTCTRTRTCMHACSHICACIHL